MKRRTFIHASADALLGACLGGLLAEQALGELRRPPGHGPRRPPLRHDQGAGLNAVEARHWRAMGDGTTLCELCPNACRCRAGERGDCQVRENRSGRLYSLVYGRPCVTRMDSVEKSPLYHFHPGDKVLSLATAGCNLSCKYCQNWEFSQQPPDRTLNYDLLPEQTVAKAKEYQAKALAYFYTEPVIYFEYAMDCAKAGRRAGLRNLMITAGYVNEVPLREMCKVTDAFAFGLKGFNDDFYQDVVGGDLQSTLNSLAIIKEEGIWVEICYLIVPTLNDDMTEIGKMASWLKTHMGPDVPLHFLRFVPKYQLEHLPPTSRSTLERAWKTAKGAGLHHVYVGNMPGHSANNTVCPRCKKEIILRIGTSLREQRLKGNRCPYCGTTIPGQWT